MGLQFILGIFGTKTNLHLGFVHFGLPFLAKLFFRALLLRRRLLFRLLMVYSFCGCFWIYDVFEMFQECDLLRMFFDWIIRQSLLNSF